MDKNIKMEYLFDNLKAWRTSQLNFTGISNDSDRI